MAVRAGVLLLLLCLWTRTTGACTVSCSTDYEALLNCSCSGPEPQEPLQLRVQCSLDDLTLTDSCVVSAKQPFCVMYPEDFEEIADVETVCSGEAFRLRDNAMISRDPSSWQLRHTVRPGPPFNVSVKRMKDSHTHVQWNSAPRWSCLTFRLRVRSCRGGSVKPVILETAQPSMQLDPSVLPPAGCRQADVQARLCPGSRYKGPWSEWSEAASWTDAADGSDGSDGMKHYYWLLALPVLLMLLCFPKVLLWQKRLKVMTYVPDPGEFFKPLYSSYQGDFKAWVKPAFAGHASLTVLDVDVTRSSLSSLCPGSGLALSPVHSVSLESVSTVSLPEPYGDLREADAPPPREPLHLSNLHIVQDLDGDEWSGNDYPLMDLDTIDSGFGECSSPPATEQLLCRHEPTDSGPGAELSRSSYVKQWTTAQDEEQSLQQDFQMNQSGPGTL